MEQFSIDELLAELYQRHPNAAADETVEQAVDMMFDRGHSPEQHRIQTLLQIAIAIGY
jgi:hypothetical protein